MFMDYSKIGEKKTIEANCKYYHKYSENFDDFTVIMILPNGAAVILKSIESFTRKTEVPQYVPKKKFYFKEYEWKEITQKQALEFLK